MKAKEKVFGRAERRCISGNNEIEAKKKQATVRFNTAHEFVPRPDDLNCVELPSSKVEKQLKAIKRRKRLEQERHVSKSANDIEREYLVAKRNYDEQVKLLKRIKGYETALSAGLQLRIARMKELAKLLRKHARSHFHNFLSVRGHTGNLLFGKNKSGAHELLITTQMASHKMADGGTYETKDLHSLSGGERSFTTLALCLRTLKCAVIQSV